MTFEKVDYVRKPFAVKVVEVTVANMEEVNEQYKLGTMERKDDGTPFIALPTKKGSGNFRVFPGYFVVEMGRNVRCFSRKIFFDQFFTNSSASISMISSNVSIVLSFRRGLLYCLYFMRYMSELSLFPFSLCQAGLRIETWCWGGASDVLLGCAKGHNFSTYRP